MKLGLFILQIVVLQSILIGLVVSFMDMPEKIKYKKLHRFMISLLITGLLGFMEWMMFVKAGFMSIIIN